MEAGRAFFMSGKERTMADEGHEPDPTEDEPTPEPPEEDQEDQEDEEPHEEANA
jgi:hypothetical protein